MTKFKPILYQTPMVEALLQGRKTMTRRTTGLEQINANPDKWIFWKRTADKFFFRSKEDNSEIWFCIPKFLEGDIMWVRETFEYSDDLDEPFWYKQKYIEEYIPEAVGRVKWKPSIHMPKEAARIFLEVKLTRVERLHDLTSDDAIAEGIERFNHGYGGSPTGVLYKDNIYGGMNVSPKRSFYTLWATINGEDSVKQNPWVFVYEFRKIEKPQNFLP